MLPGETIAVALRIRARTAIRSSTTRCFARCRLLHRNAMLLRTLLARIRLLPDGRGS